MNSNIISGLSTRTLTAAAILGAASLVTFDADAQQLRYSATAPGGIASTGNTLGLAKATDENGPGLEHSIGTFISLDPTSVDDDPLNDANPWSAGTTWDWTLNGSTGVLDLPEWAEVLHAELVWGGSYNYWPENVSNNLDVAITLATETDSFLVSPDLDTAQTLDETSYTGFAAHYYIRSADVTSFVKQHGATTYSVSGVPATQSTMIDALNAAGWTLVVAYRAESSPIRNLSIFVGGSFVDEDSEQDYGITGFCAPPYGVVEGNVVISAMEGDAALMGDELAIAQTAEGSFASLSGANNPAANFFGSQITDANGHVDMRGSFGTINHDAINGVQVPGGRQGWDLATVALSSTKGHLVNGQTSAVIRTTTTGDSYVPTLVALELDVKSPDFGGSNTFADVQEAELGDTFMVTTTLTNAGEAEAEHIMLTMPLDPGLELQHFAINGQAGDRRGNTVTSADLTNGVDVGTLQVGEQLEVQLTLSVIAEPQDGLGFSFGPTWYHSFVVCAGDTPIEESHNGPPTTVPFSAEPEPDPGTGGEGGGEPVPDPEPEPEPEPIGVGGGNGTQVTDRPGVPPIQEEGGCACSAPGVDQNTGRAGGLLALLAMALGVALRRRR